MPIADRRLYLANVVAILEEQFPENRIVNVACHGHSIPAGYSFTPMVDSFSAYPHLLHRGLKERFPFSVVNVIVTGIGGEQSETGAARFQRDVLCHRPDLVSVDYGLHDRALGLQRARDAWVKMIEEAVSRGTAVLLLTPAANITYSRDDPSALQVELEQHASQIRALAAEYGVGLVDTLRAYRRHSEVWGDLSDLFSRGNHPSRSGHQIIARELLRWFPPRPDGRSLRLGLG